METLKYNGHSLRIEDNNITFKNNDDLLSYYYYLNDLNNKVIKQLKNVKKTIMDKIGDSDHLRSRSWIANLKLTNFKEYTVPAGIRRSLKVNSIV